ncbi:2-amino-4-hydroxy-6-hydroxymethyldihydropteridine diphosphokinase [Sphingobium sp. AN558]|uniref:2-amino-4-hydroxy-6- hydroxymethyldihydropteridine diphosphokinase n=1 Tax=Sphingobium sp. AN558 TaxID=3133442 RepID=UPI0030BC7253
MVQRPAVYALALGSNRALSASLTPRRLIDAAALAIAGLGRVIACSPTLSTPPLGPSARRFANAALLLESALPPDRLLVRLQQIERSLGRRRHRRWGARSMDIDIILWSGGRWRSRALTIPHLVFRQRDFVLRPILTIAADWRDPATGLTIRQLESRLKKARPKPPARG